MTTISTTGSRPAPLRGVAMALAMALFVSPAFAEPLPVVATAIAADAAWDLGVVLELRRPYREGMEVLAVTPDGAAARLGLRRGDRIHAINGRSLTGPAPADAYADAISRSHGRVSLDVVREGNPLQLSGELALVSQVPIAGCGYVTTIDATPRSKESVFSAEITMIDGESTPLAPQNRHQLPVGRRVLVVAERIDDHRFNDSQNLQRRNMKQREMARAYKALIVDVAPDTAYSIGARLLTDRLDSASIRDNAYWEPVAWRSVHTRCR